MAVFLDRDGTIGGDCEVQYPGEFHLYPLVKERIALLKDFGVKIFSFTNQPGIAKGEETVESFHEEMLSFGFDGVYLCPHSHKDGCSCRKPLPGLLYQAAQDHQLDLSKCVVIGDRWSDMVAAQDAGCYKILVLTGAGEEALGKYRHKWKTIKPDYVASNIIQAIQWLFVKGDKDIG
nr:HAD-IIIA family hydrolase [Shimazuella alba]